MDPMKPAVRAATPEDQQAIAELLARVFASPASSAFLEPALMRWKYVEARDDWREPRAYVIAREGRVVAHAGVWPITVARAGQVLRGVHMIDWAADRDQPGAGMAVLQRLTRMFDFVWAIGGSESTRQVLPAFGFKIAGQVWTAARPLRPLAQILSHPARNWRLAPRLVRNWYWSVTPRVRVRAGCAAAPVTAASLPEEAAGFGDRPRAFFEYVLRCPGAGMRLYGLTSSAGGEGHMLMSFVQRQARIAGIWLRRPSAGNWRAAYVLAQTLAAASGDAAEIVTAGYSPLTAEAAARVGFRNRSHAPLFLFDKQGCLDPAEIEFRMADNDFMFLNEGRPSYHT
jgi:hypothetical protein